MRYICTSIVATLVLAGTSFAATINVPGDYATIQGAIDAAQDGDQILIAPGTYYEHEVNPNGKAIVIKGFVDGDGNPTSMIDGENGSWNVLYIDSGETGTTVFENLVIRNGAAGNGSGMFIRDNSNPVLRNCVIESNEAVLHDGGGVVCDDSSPEFIGCTFRNNTANLTGGAVWINGNSSPSFTDCLIENNAAATQGGGGINCKPNTSVTLTNCTFVGNTTPWGGGGLCLENNVNATILNCTFSGNEGQEGGGVYSYHCNPSLTDCYFSDNEAILNGGGIFCRGGAQIIANCHFTSNNAAAYGGGVFCDTSSTASLTDTVIEQNNAQDGGGIFCGGDSQPAIVDCVIAGNAATWRGGGIWCYQDPQITGCVISNNSSKFGGGIYGGTPALTNTTVCGNDPDQVNSDWTDNGGNEILEVCPPGACCTNGGCVISEEDDCVTFLGNWLGMATNCDDCPTSCAGDTDGNGVVNIEDLLIVIGDWGLCP
jgi:parallel beta-helix repeat protein/predicted outer membrane repeat protein